MPPRKKKKVKQEEEPLYKVWRSFEEIPAEPQNMEKRRLYRMNLAESVVEAVTTGNIPFVRQVLQSAIWRDKLIFRNPNYGRSTPGQPSFGLLDLIWGYRQITSKNLLIEAIQSGQIEMLRQLLALGIFDINAVMSRDSGGWDISYTYPLLVAVRCRNVEMVSLLLEQPHIYVTYPETKVCKTIRNGRYRPHCKATALTEAAELGLLDIVKLLIEKGAALQPSSTSRSDDPFSMVKAKYDEAQQLVELSLQEALWEAHNRADPNPQRLYSNTSSTGCDILEYLLTKTGGPSSDDEHHVVETLITSKIQTGRWEDDYRRSHDYRDVFDFDLRTEANPPSLRAIAIVRGWRAAANAAAAEQETTADNENDSEEKDSMKNKMVQQSKYWSTIVQTCRKRIKEAPYDWRHAVENQVADRGKDIYDHSFTLALELTRKTTQMLRWCDLLGAPFSTDRYMYYDEATRRYIREIAHIGSVLNRRMEEQQSGGTVALKHIWDREVLSYVVD